MQNGQIPTDHAYHEILLDEKRVARTQPQLRAVPWHYGPAVTLDIGTPGLLDTLQFREDLTRETPLGPNEVEIKAEVWPVSFRDVFIALGRLKESSRMMGYECAGTVTRIGAGCSSAFSVGDRVVMCTFGCMRSYPRATADAVFRVPDSLSLNEAVAVINPGMTAYHALINVARLRRGEKVLIHSAAGATGQFAVGVAKMLGAEVLATVGHDDKKRLLMERFGIPDDHIFHSRDPSSFTRGVMRVTGGCGVDVMLNSLSGDGLLASWECVAPYGHFVETGKVDIGANSSLPMRGFAKNASFAAIDLVHIANTDITLTRQLTEKVLELAAAAASNVNAAGFVGCPSPLHLYPVSQVEKAFRSMQNGKQSGRILVSVHDADIVPKFMVEQNTWIFDSNASYVVAGGLGGLGRPMVRWMADRGAKYLILLSRSGGAQSQAAVELISELRKRGVHVSTPRCDISSASALSAALESVLNTTESHPFPPVKGCINATMVLQDAIFENMTHAQWSSTIRSKVNTSWNLHTLLPNNLDFFILLSSISGIYGSAGQSNYAAGCTFQDALARSRTASGHRASVSLDLGWMRDDGVVHESSNLQRRIASTSSKFTPVATADLLALLDHYCDPALPQLTLDQSQIVVGMTTPREIAARGGDVSWALRTNLFLGLDVRSTEGDDNTESKINGKGKEGGGADSFSHLFKQADTAQTRTKVVVAALQAKLARALGVQVEDIDTTGKGLADYGVDSLMAVELRNWMKKDFGVTLAVFEIMRGGRSIRDVGGLVGEGWEMKSA